MPTKESKKIEFYNKKARFNYLLEDTFEAGIVLNGEEIKAIRSGRINMSNSYAKILSGEIFWVGANFSNTTEPDRSRKLLLKREQIEKLAGKIEAQGYTLVPVKLYITRGKAKLELGLGKGKKKFDKRETMKQRDLEREIERRIKS